MSFRMPSVKISDSVRPSLKRDANNHLRKGRRREYRSPPSSMQGKAVVPLLLLC